MLLYQVFFQGKTTATLKAEINPIKNLENVSILGDIRGVTYPTAKRLGYAMHKMAEFALNMHTAPQDASWRESRLGA
jgi:hypothetical protein